MKLTFNLINQKWIPIVTTDFQSQQVSILDLLISAHKIKEISAATPIETVALYRLHLALLHAMFQMTEDQWKVMWSAKQFDVEIVQNYLQKWTHRFDLFDAERPFLQDPLLQCALEPASSLLGHVSSGNDSTLFDHNTSVNSKRFSPSEAAMGLLSIHAFGVGGTKRPGSPLTDGYCARGIVFCVTGRNLFETLMLNLYDPDDLSDYRLKRRGGDKPTWEMDDPYETSAYRPYGLRDHLTWLNRKVLLLPVADFQGDVYVQQMRYDAGLRTSEGAREVFNPMYHWRANTRKTTSDEKSRSHSPMPLNPEKALWRNSHVIMKLANKATAELQRDKPVAALVWLADLARQGAISPQSRYTLSGFGVATKSGQDKTFFYRAETMPLSLNLLSNDELIEELTIAITKAQDGADVMNRALHQLARWLFAPNKTDSDLRKEDRERISQLARSWNAEERYWSTLEPHFHRFIGALPDHPDKAIETWHTELGRAAKTAFDYAERCVTGDPRAARAIAVASVQFYGGLKGLFPKRVITQESDTDEESDF